jgi:bifunctional UDP-N-acetylglucosamine pyrophosphorylase/glucosamine-1-phosphate N-acetyltransferase
MEVRPLPPEQLRRSFPGERLPVPGAAGTKGGASDAATDSQDVSVPKKSSPSLAVVVLAAGRGKRLKSKLPKVLHPVCGRPILWHVLRAASKLKPQTLAVVVANGREVEDAVRSWNLSPEPVFVDQGEPLGTGHAVLAAEDAVGKAHDVVVLPGDEALVTGDMLVRLLKTHRRRNATATIQTTELSDARGFARVVRDGDRFIRLAEDPRSDAEIRSIREIATCVYAFRRTALYAALPLVGNENRQREYYLPDTPGILVDKGEPIVVEPADLGDTVGANSRAELAKATAVMRRRINASHMDAGVTLMDPDRTYVDVDVRIGADSVIHPLTFLEGSTRIGKETVIGPSTRIVDSSVGDGSEVQFSVVRGARVGRGVSVGPYASVRPGTVLDDGSKAGTFVEIKASRVGAGSKVPHLSYVGDTKVGKRVNVGAATVTANYDGYDKHETVIEDDARIGSDTMLVAPVRVGKGAVTGAGSVITQDVPPGSLAVERSEQRIVEGYRKRKDREREGRKRGGSKSSGH